MKKKIEIELEEDIYEKFCMALKLTKEEQPLVVENCIRKYIADSFEKVSRAYSSSINQRNHEEDVDYYGKAKSRIPVWAMKPQQYNHKIIRAFLLAEQDYGTVSLSVLEELCSNQADDLLYVPTLKSNYAQMKIDSSRSHGKVFEDDGYTVSIWNVVEPVVMEYRDFFLGTHNEGALNMKKITNQMVECAYDIGKKVYAGTVRRTDARTMIAKETEMNESSAAYYITAFLAMMDGKKYTATINTYATRYYLTNIEKDFGANAFQRAKNAVAAHVEYYNGLGYGTLNEIQMLLDELS